ncbi:erythromycin esterase family protein [Mangrovibacterium marinum]|uniref:erythromycin esterase family protein n=1 Tax=Mangrovibacterium marinum TaxID=1639118 RepID=UPI002A18750D|nr:erythromycin esterase family protein [Mangrovibacterium marinum]
MIKIFVLLPILYLLFACSGSYFEDRNFSFENKKPDKFSWGHFTNHSGVVVKDTLDFVDGKQSLQFRGVLANYFETYLMQTFLLPAKTRQIEISIYSKSNIIEDAWLKVWCLDHDEAILIKDSVSIVSSGKWNRFGMKLKVPLAEKMYIEIASKAKDTLVMDFENIQFLKIDKLQLDCNGKNIYKYHIPKSKTVRFQNNRIIEIDTITIKGVAKIPSFENHRIIALGESVHGSKQVQAISYEIIKYLIENENCRLVLLELPFELGLLLNDHVMGYTNENITELLTLIAIDVDQFTRFINWVKDYNTKTKKKVAICGIDDSKGVLQSYYLWAFINNQHLIPDSIIPLRQFLVKNDMKSALQLVCNNTVFNELDSIKKPCMIRALEMRWKKNNPATYLMEGNREYMQFINTQFAINIWLPDSAKAVIYAHLLHVNKKNQWTGRPYIPNFGNYMVKEYGKEYFVAGMLVGEGYISNNDMTGTWCDLPLEKPVGGSIEKSCMNMYKPFFYMDLDGEPSSHFIRTLGAAYLSNQFFSYSYKNRMDALFFIRHSEGYRLPECWPAKKEKIEEFLRNRFLLKY